MLVEMCSGLENINESIFAVTTADNEIKKQQRRRTYDSSRH